MALPRAGVIGQVPDTAAQGALPSEPKQRVEQLRDAGSLRVDGRTIRASMPIATLYEARSFNPHWTTSPAAADLLRTDAESGGNRLAG